MVDFLSLGIIIFFTWNDKNGVDNWDKLDKIIDVYYKNSLNKEQNNEY